MKVFRDIIGRQITIYECECCDVGNHRIMPAGNRIFEDQYTVAYSSLNVPLLGFIVIAPKRHVESFEELSDDEKASLFNVSMAIKAALEKMKISEEFSNIELSDNGHAKIWIMPRLNGIFEDSFDFRLLENRFSMERRNIPVAQASDILYLNRKLRTFLSK